MNADAIGWKRVQVAALLGVLVEAILVVPLFITSSSRAIPAWAYVITELHQPGLSLVESMLKTGWVAQIAKRHRAAPEIFLAAECVVMLIQALLFGLFALGLIYVWQLRRRREGPPT